MYTIASMGSMKPVPALTAFHQSQVKKYFAGQLFAQILSNTFVV